MQVAERQLQFVQMVILPRSDPRNKEHSNIFAPKIDVLISREAIGQMNPVSYLEEAFQHQHCLITQDSGNCNLDSSLIAKSGNSSPHPINRQCRTFPLPIQIFRANNNNISDAVAPHPMPQGSVPSTLACPKAPENVQVDLMVVFIAARSSQCTRILVQITLPWILIAPP
jgi:hypothetical protein